MTSNGVVWRVEKAIRERSCSVCPTKIPSGTWHGVFNSNSQYSKNVCMACVERLNHDLLVKNGFVCARCGAVNSSVAETQVGNRTEMLCDHCHASFAGEV